MCSPVIGVSYWFDFWSVLNSTDVMTPNNILVCFSDSPVRISWTASTQEEGEGEREEVEECSVWTPTVLNLADRS